MNFLSDKDLRLFAVWCAREALKLVKHPDIRSIEACNVAERYANGEATKEELYSANESAWAAARDAKWTAARAAEAAWATARTAMTAARVLSREAAGNTRNLQLNYLLTYFK